MNRKKAKYIGHVSYGDCFLQNVIEGEMCDEEEDVSRYWKTLRKRESIGNWKREH
jgi:hypothetical protein